MSTRLEDYAPNWKMIHLEESLQACFKRTEFEIYISDFERRGEGQMLLLDHKASKETVEFN